MSSLYVTTSPSPSSSNSDGSLRSRGSPSTVDETRSPSPSNSSSDDKLSLKRATRSAIEKKSRHRRQNVMKEMREELQRLQITYDEMLQQHQASSARDGGSLNESIERWEKHHKLEDLPRLVTRLSVEIEALDDAKRSLVRLVREHEMFHQALQALRDEHAAQIMENGIPIGKSFAAAFDLMSPTQCYGIIRDSSNTMKRFESRNDYLSTGALFMGWTDKRRFDEETSALQYGFTKRFEHHRAEELMMKTWNVMTSDKQWAMLSFGTTAVEMTFKVLQVMNDDFAVIRRDHKHPGIAMTFLTAHVLFRIETPTGYSICFRTVPAPKIQAALEEHEVWFDVFHWSHFNHIYDSEGNAVGCEVVTGGSMSDPTLMIANHWLFELMLSVLRWESMCVAPLFLCC